jgi:hypothetical protein
VIVLEKMASQTQGIQQLLAAEKRAAEKVGEARKSTFKFYFEIFLNFSWIFLGIT